MHNIKNHWSDWLIIPAMAVLMALSYAIFVFPNSFAPAGINGIITMIQYLLHIDIGYLSLAVNLPLFLLTWKSAGNGFSIRSLGKCFQTLHRKNCFICSCFFQETDTVCICFLYFCNCFCFTFCFTDSCFLTGFRS